jgi:hypothetical protein
MTSKARHISHLLSILVVGGLSISVACSSGGDSGSGGSSTGGTSTGGKSGGTGGGNASGGNASGGSSSGGNPSGGSATGGKATGGSASGGNASGGNPSGGNASGGNPSGGSASGGNPSGGAGGSGTGGAGGGISGCSNTDQNTINMDASGYVCNNKWGIKGAWYCYSDGSDSTTSCKGSDGKGMGAIPWTAASSAMCLKGKIGSGSGKYVGMGFKVNSGPPGGTDTPGAWNASGIVGFAVTLAPGASGMGSGGMVLNLEYPTTDNLAPSTLDAPGVTLPGVGSTAITYNVLFADAVLANTSKANTSVDPTKLTDVKIAFFPDSVEHSYDFCIKSIVPLTTAPSPVVAAGAYGPTWSNKLPQAVNGINGYAVQSAPFPTDGNAMTMQVTATATGVGFSYKTGSGFNAPNNGPGSFPAIISGWGPGHDGIQFYGPYKGNKTISQLQSVKSNWSFTMEGSGDAAYDVWFSNSPKPPYSKPGIELMVWIGNKDKMPLGYGNPAGSPVMGLTPYVGTNGTGEAVVSYWVDPSKSVNSVTNFDLLQFFKDAATHGYAGLKNDSVLLGIQTGFEVYSGTWTTTDYNIDIK